MKRVFDAKPHFFKHKLNNAPDASHEMIFLI